MRDVMLCNLYVIESSCGTNVARGGQGDARNVCVCLAAFTSGSSSISVYEEDELQRV